MSTKYYARRPFDYGDKQVDRGQVLELLGLRNDEKLIRLGFVLELRRGEHICPCGVCGAQFVGDNELNAHGAMRHANRFQQLSPEEEDRQLDRQEKMLEQVAPLYLDKTAASAADHSPVEIHSSTPKGAAKKGASKRAKAAGASRRK